MKNGERADALVYDTTVRQVRKNKKKALKQQKTVKSWKTNKITPKGLLLRPFFCIIDYARLNEQAVKWEVVDTRIAVVYVSGFSI
jgi:hypothetical protein